GQGRVEFLVEAADPCGDPRFAYTCDGVRVSDFCTPRFFDPVAVPGVQYSLTGALTKPRYVLPGGYLTWHDPVADQWWQLTWSDGNQPQTGQIQAVDITHGCIRARIDRLTEAHRATIPSRAPRVPAKHPLVAPTSAESSRARQRMWRECVDRIRAG